MTLTLGECCEQGQINDKDVFADVQLTKEKTLKKAFVLQGLTGRV